MTKPLIKRENLDTDRNTGRMPSEDNGRDRGTRPQAKELCRWPANPTNGRLECWDRFSLPALGRLQPC